MEVIKQPINSNFLYIAELQQRVNHLLHIGHYCVRMTKISILI